MTPDTIRAIVREELAALGLQGSEALTQVGDLDRERVESGDVEPEGVAHPVQDAADLLRELQSRSRQMRKDVGKGVRAGIFDIRYRHLAKATELLRAGEQLEPELLHKVIAELHQDSSTSVTGNPEGRRAGGNSVPGAPSSCQQLHRQIERQSELIQRNTVALVHLAKRVETIPRQVSHMAK